MPEDQTTTADSSDETLNESSLQAETATTTAANGETPETTTTDTSSQNDLQEQIKRMEAALKKANADAKTHRLKNSELEKSLGELKTFREQVEAEKLTDQQKQELARQNLEKQLADMQKAHDDAQREKQEIRIEHAVSTHAQRLGFADPEDARRFLDLSEMEYDAQGRPTNVEALLKQVLKGKPYLAGKTPPLTSGGATNPPRSQSSGANQEITASTVSQYLTPETYSKLSPEQKQKVSQILANAGRFGGRLK